MQITKELEAELTAVLADYWDSYTRGDLERWASYLLDNYHNIGTNEEEIWSSKQEIVDFTRQVLDQFAGKVEVRDRQYRFMPAAPYMMAHEFGNLYVRSGDDWTFYAKLRLSTLLDKTGNGWKILHQHGSYPDNRLEHGEFFGFENLLKENTELRDAVKRRTVELELKKEALEESNAALQKSLEELKETQKQLIQSEKMASLGELTAGIAHEIQNPLNFVNNFSEVSKELLDEMKTELDSGNTDEAKEIAEDVIRNLEKIIHHGKRADAIVKGMLQHSRSSSGVKEPTDINALCDEYLRLAYHGLRAKDKSFNATLKTDFDESIGKISLVPQDIGRVVLNLITNAFYAVTEKGKQSGENFEPVVSVSTKQINGNVKISVSDNGNGIPASIVDKIFQPFFTTKPTGQGTGLGLSMSYDIVTKGHGGELKVETGSDDPGKPGTTFIISLPF